jgi:hypothetical protein
MRKRNEPRPVVQYTIAGKKVKEYKSVTETWLSGFGKNGVRSVLTRMSKQHRGFVFRYKDEPYHGENAVVLKPKVAKPKAKTPDFYMKPIVQYSLDGKKLNEFKTVSEAAISNNTHRGNIRKVAKGEAIQLRGFVFRYKGDPYHGEYADFSRKRKVIQYSIEGKKIAQYPSIIEASQQSGIDGDTIIKCARKKRYTTLGFVWRYEGEPYRGEYKGKIKNKANPIIQYTPEGKKVAQYASINVASRESGFSASTITDCVHKRTKIAHGHVWRFVNEPYKGELKNYRRGKPVTQYTLDGKKIDTYETIEFAAKATGLTPDNIQKNAKGENKTAGGFVWKYASPKEIKNLPISIPDRSSYDLGGTEVIQYSIDGKKVAAYKSISEAARKLNVNVTNISGAVDKEGRTAGGFVWRTKGNRYYGELLHNAPANRARLVTQYDLAGKRIAVFKSTRDAEKNTGIPSTTISAVARGKLSMTGGFMWQYGEGPVKINAYKRNMPIRRRSNPRFDW